MSSEGCIFKVFEDLKKESWSAGLKVVDGDDKEEEGEEEEEEEEDEQGRLGRRDCCRAAERQVLSPIGETTQDTALVQRSKAAAASCSSLPAISSGGLLEALTLVLKFSVVTRYILKNQLGKYQILSICVVFREKVYYLFLLFNDWH